MERSDQFKRHVSKYMLNTADLFSEDHGTSCSLDNKQQINLVYESEKGAQSIEIYINIHTS